jgi:hypothetical protein
MAQLHQAAMNHNEATKVAMWSCWSCLFNCTRLFECMTRMHKHAYAGSSCRSRCVRIRGGQEDRVRHRSGVHQQWVNPPCTGNPPPSPLLGNMIQTLTKPFPPTLWLSALPCIVPNDRSYTCIHGCTASCRFSPKLLKVMVFLNPLKSCFLGDEISMQSFVEI